MAIDPINVGAVALDPGEVRYEWRDGARAPVPATVAAAEFKAIYDEHGAVEPQVVVQRAQDPAHPLHGCFEWDDTEAAKRHRETQAMYLLRSLMVVPKAPTKALGPVRYMMTVRPPSEAEAPYRYLPTEVIHSVDKWHEARIQQCVTELKSIRRRYRDLDSDMASLFVVLDALLGR